MEAHRICLLYDVFWCTKKLFGAIITSDVALFGEAIMVDWIIIDMLLILFLQNCCAALLMDVTM